MKVQVSEEQYHRYIERSLEEEYPVTWNIDEFKQIKSFRQRIQYCENNLVRISSGSSRIVYKIDNTKVLKLAKNQKGLAQNGVEIGFSNDYLWDGIVAEIFDYDENELWVEMELARKLSVKIFENIVGFSFDEYCDGLRYIEWDLNPKRSYMKRRKPERYDEMWENDFVSRMFEMIPNYDLPVGDLTKLNTYGVVNRNGENEVVMIDYGLTYDVYNSYYN